MSVKPIDKNFKNITKPAVLDEDMRCIYEVVDTNETDEVAGANENDEVAGANEI